MNIISVHTENVYMSLTTTCRVVFYFMASIFQFFYARPDSLMFLWDITKQD